MHINRFRVSGLCYKFCRTSPTKIASFTGLSSEISKNTVKVTRISFDGRGSKKFWPLRGTDLEQHWLSSSCHIFSAHYPKRYGNRNKSSGGHFRFQQPKRYQFTNFDPWKVWWAPPSFFHRSPPPPPSPPGQRSQSLFLHVLTMLQILLSSLSLLGHFGFPYT